MDVMPRQSVRITTVGFTLVEMMVAIALFVIVASLAVPAYTDFVMRKRAASGINDFLVDLNVARGEATRSQRVRIQRLATPMEPTPMDAPRRELSNAFFRAS